MQAAQGEHEAAKEAGVAPPAEIAESVPEVEEGKENGGGVKSAADIKKLLAARAAAGKKKESAGSAAVAEASKEAKRRATAKKKVGQHWETTGHQRGAKARGSDNKYQGE